jgi:uncharacterized coiled-coil protein SlyX
VTRPALCSSAKNGAVTVPNSSGACAKGTTAFAVASDAAVQALATRLGTAETENADQATTIAALQAQNATQAQVIQDLHQADEVLANRISELRPGVLTLTAWPQPPTRWVWILRGSNLKPGAPVIVHFVDEGVPREQERASVADDGSVFLEDVYTCELTELYITTVTWDDRPVSSNTIQPGPVCS